MLQLLSVAVPGVVLLDWSKTGAFLTTAQRPSKQEDGQPAKNIKVRVWCSSSGSSSSGRAEAAAAGGRAAGKEHQGAAVVVVVQQQQQRGLQHQQQGVQQQQQPAKNIKVRRWRSSSSSSIRGFLRHQGQQ
jgi:hypothetical protein